MEEPPAPRRSGRNRQISASVAAISIKPKSAVVNLKTRSTSLSTKSTTDSSKPRVKKDARAASTSVVEERGRKASSTTSSTREKTKSKRTVSSKTVKADLVEATSSTTAATAAKKKSVRFTSDTKSEKKDKENLVPSEDELVAVTPKSVKKTIDKLQENSSSSNVQAVSSFKSSLKRRLDDDVGTQAGPSTKIARVDAAVEKPRPRIPMPANRVPRGGKKSSIRSKPMRPTKADADSLPTITESFVSLGLEVAGKSASEAPPTFLGPLATPAKRPPQPLKDVTPAARASTIFEDELNPFVASTTKSASMPIPASARKLTASNDIFSSSHSAIPNATPAKRGWLFSAKDAAQDASHRSSNLLATPARRPAHPESFSIKKTTAEEPAKALFKTSMTCPPKRPVSMLGSAMKGSVASKLDMKAPPPVLGSLATPARKPPSSLFKQTASTLAKVSPSPTHHRSGLEVVPRRRDRDDRSVSPRRSPDKFAVSARERSPVKQSSLHVSPVRPMGRSQLGNKTATPRPSNAFAEQASRPSVSRSSISSRIPVSSPKTSPKKDSTPIKPATTLPRKSLSASPPKPINRQLFRPSSPAKREIPVQQPAPSAFDVYVDEDARDIVLFGDVETSLVNESLTSQQIFGNSPPRTLGGRRESGLFMPSPDRDATALGPFTTKIGGKHSPFKDDYRKDVDEEDVFMDIQGVRRSTGNIFLDESPRIIELIGEEEEAEAEMEAREELKMLEAGAAIVREEEGPAMDMPHLVHSKTVKVALKFDDDEEEEEEQKPATPVVQKRVASVGSPRTFGTGGSPMSPRRASGTKKALPPLTSCVVYVEVFTAEGADASASFVADLKKLGAKVVKTWSTAVTHVVFKDGSPTILGKVKLSKGSVKCVGVGWVKSCKETLSKIDEAEFLVDMSDHMTPLRRRRRSSMAPRLLTPGRLESAIKVDQAEDDNERSGPSIFINVDATPLATKNTIKKEEEDEDEDSFHFRTNENENNPSPPLFHFSTATATSAKKAVADPAKKHVKTGAGGAVNAAEAAMARKIEKARRASCPHEPRQSSPLKNEVSVGRFADLATPKGQGLIYRGGLFATERKVGGTKKF